MEVSSSSWRYPNSWMVYNGTPDWNGWFGTTPILGNPPISVLFSLVKQHSNSKLRVEMILWLNANFLWFNCHFFSMKVLIHEILGGKAAPGPHIPSLVTSGTTTGWSGGNATTCQVGDLGWWVRCYSTNPLKISYINKGIWLVVWNINFIFPIYWVSIIIPIDELIFFRGVALAHQPGIVILDIWGFPES